MADSKSVLIVDDDKFLLEMYCKKFRQAGLEADYTAGSEEALTRLREGTVPDILLLDIIMPAMDGLELLETIRSEKLAEDSIIIMLTNESDPAKVEKAKSLGIKGYIVKATAVPSEVVDETLKIAGLKKQND